MEVPESGPLPEPVPSPVADRTFHLGFVQENPIDQSEKAMEEMLEKIGQTADVLNMFFHVHWCELTGETVAWAYRNQLRQAQLARAAGLQMALTFDFTHENPENVGHVNPLPDGTPLSLNDPRVAAAYKNELLALCSLVQPEYVIVGIETNIFFMLHPEQWAAYVKMFKEIANALTAEYPGIHVTAYFTLDWMVDANARLNLSHANIWRQLLPELQSIAYSTYPEVLGLNGVELAPGYFRKAAEIAPELPVMLPEFGVPGGPQAQLSFDEQTQFARRIFEEISQTRLKLACWFSVYDQSYPGVPEPFKIAFRHIGMHTQDGTPKPVWALWEAIYQSNSTDIKTFPSISAEKPEQFELFQNYPNPFNATTTIRYRLPEESQVIIKIYNLSGQIVRTLIERNQTAGIQAAIWNGLGDNGLPVASGIYFCNLCLEGTPINNSRLVLLK